MCCGTVRRGIPFQNRSAHAKKTDEEMSLLSSLCNLLPIHDGKIVFYSFTESFADNPRAIAEELLRREWKGDLVWVAKDQHQPLELPQGIRAAVGRCRMRYELSTSQIIVSNTRLPRYWTKGFRKKAGQLYIQTWHGSLGIKKMEADMPYTSRSYLKRAQMDSERIDYLISNCRWLTQMFRRCFFYDGEILEIGSPRNDVLVLGTAKRAKTVRAALGLPPERKLLLYVPTFRDENRTLNPPMPDWKQLGRALTERFGGEWSILVRMHPSLSREPREQLSAVREKQILDFTNYPDMTDLLVIADAVVTDYSSCIYDFLLTGRPGFIYAPDYATYEKQRGLYYPLKETPFPIAETGECLAHAVRSFDESAYRIAAEQFLRTRGCVDDGHASGRIADLIESILNGKEEKA